jgi:hypothetical protein
LQIKKTTFSFFFRLIISKIIIIYNENEKLLLFHKNRNILFIQNIEDYIQKEKKKKSLTFIIIIKNLNHLIKT